MDSSSKAGLFFETASGARPDDSSSRAGPSEVARNSPSASNVALETVQRAFDSSSRAVASGMTPQQSRRVTSASDISDGFGASNSARRDSRSVTPPSGRMSPELQRISPMTFLMPSDPKQAAAHGDDSSTWGVGVEVGSPGLELPSDEESEAGSRHAGYAEVASDRVTQAAREGGGARDGGGAVLREDSAQFGPEASAMSLPGEADATCSNFELSDDRMARPCCRIRDLSDNSMAQPCCRTRDLSDGRMAQRCCRTRGPLAATQNSPLARPDIEELK